MTASWTRNWSDPITPGSPRKSSLQSVRAGVMGGLWRRTEGAGIKFLIGYPADRFGPLDRSARGVAPHPSGGRALPQSGHACPLDTGIPRYIDLVGELPRTENGKVQKYKLRERGVTPTCWDRTPPRG